MLKKAQAEHYGVGLFNTTDTDMAEAVISAAEEMNSPVIIGTAEVLLPYGELKLIAPSIRALAERAKVPVVLHYDHGLTFDRCIEALKLGFSSIMFDGSAGDSKQNIADTAEIVKIAHSFGASVEGEIGHVGQASSGDGELTNMYTTPEEARAFVEATGVDALAVAIGTAHGQYKTTPKLDINRLKEIYDIAKKPLVLHGGSGLSDKDFKDTSANGIRKVYICTEMCLAAHKAYAESLGKVSFEPTLDLAKKAVEDVVKQKMQLFGSSNKA